MLGGGDNTLTPARWAEAPELVVGAWCISRMSVLWPVVHLSLCAWYITRLLFTVNSTVSWIEILLYSNLCWSAGIVAYSLILTLFLRFFKSPYTRVSQNWWFPTYLRTGERGRSTECSLKSTGLSSGNGLQTISLVLTAFVFLLGDLCEAEPLPGITCSRVCLSHAAGCTSPSRTSLWLDSPLNILSPIVTILPRDTIPGSLYYSSGDFSGCILHQFWHWLA
jgi:hypothetical protein